VQAALDAGVTVAQIERETEVPSISIAADNYVGARDAMDHLIQLGHQRIAFIGGDPRLSPYRGRLARSVEEERLAAYDDALAAAGIPADAALVKLGIYYDIPTGGSGAEGCRHMEALLQLEPRPTAVFATCDILAAGAFQALHAARLRVPDDMSVIGFDDTLASNFPPPLSTVAQPMRQMGAEAFRLVVSEFGPASERAPLVSLPTTFVERASTAPPSKI
jgi:LacI family transcriptional regulator